MKNTKDKEKLRFLFLKYLMSNGFDSQDIRNILEVGNAVENSVSVILPQDRYTQFLISTKVQRSALDEYKVNGNSGYIYRGEMYRLTGNSDVPKEEDKITTGPDIKDFDALLSMGFGNEQRHALYSLNMIKKFVGQCIAYENERNKLFYDNLYQFERQYMDEECGGQHILVTDVDSKENIGYYLIMKK